ncbi:MAG: PAS domain-containing protein [Caldilineaceae bacterium]|nr:PAS domain-containing protein [Caldilineaceae bacterium]
MLLTPISLLFYVAAVVALIVAWQSWRRRMLPGAATLAALMIVVALWALTEGTESASVQLAQTIVLAKLSHIGIQAMPALFLLFVSGYTQRRDLHWPHVAALWLVPVFALFMVFTNDQHHLFWVDVQLVTGDAGSTAAFSYGPLFWIVSAYQYGLMAVAMFLLIRAAVHRCDIYRRQAIVVIGAALLPGAANLVYVFQVNPYPELDWTPIAFVVTGALMVYAISRLQLFEPVPAARSLLVENMCDAVLVLDDRQRIIDANRAAYTLIGARTKLIGSAIRTVLPALDDESWLALGDQEEQRIVSGGAWSDCWLDARCTPLVAPDGTPTGHLLLLRDVTQQLKTEEELLEAKRAVEVALRARSEFLSTISHELRTPLTSVVGLAEALQEPLFGDLSERQRRALRTIEQNGRHLTSLINDILELSQAEAGRVEIHPQLIRASELCELCLSGIRGMAAAKRQQLELSIQPLELALYLDARHFVRILANLLNNAVKFTADGGKLGIEVVAHEQGVTLAVWDTGIGIAPEECAHLFEPFVQLDSKLARKYDGAGLGLALAYRLVMLHGGRLDVESTPGVGSRFVITLSPAALPASSPMAVVAA